MGKIKYQKQIKEFIKKTPVFSIKDLKKIIPNDYAKLLLHNLVKKDEVIRITKGYYSRFEDPILIAYCIKPSYIGLENALSLHNLWEQETNVTLLTPRKIRQGTRKVQGNNVIIKKIKPNHFFGFEYLDYNTLKIPVSDIEKTFIDLVYFNKYLDKELIKEMKKQIKKKKLNKYLDNYDKNFKDKIKTKLSLN
ncbi:MAG: type IV toxin-antitoxin system AbiEi family antitoxin domain-containing protein [Nanoarchaeota archaeon]